MILAMLILGLLSTDNAGTILEALSGDSLSLRYQAFPVTFAFQ